jgi:hypothetical protein
MRPLVNKEQGLHATRKYLEVQEINASLIILRAKMESLCFFAAASQSASTAARTTRQGSSRDPKIEAPRKN